MRWLVRQIEEKVEFDFFYFRLFYYMITAI